MQDPYEKLDDDAALGVPHIWVIDPKTGIFKRYADTSLIVPERFAFNERGIAFDLGRIEALLQN